MVKTNGISAPQILLSKFNPAPIAIGGVGGSGTRLVAELVSRSGIFIGNNLNKANDNLSFIPARKLLDEQDGDVRQTEVSAALRSFEEQMHVDFQSACKNTHETHEKGTRLVNWGWKVPGQFHILPYTSRYFPELKYIHVVRHGLDMAFSRNKNQMHRWGPKLGVHASSPEDPYSSLQYWIVANQLAIEHGSAYLGDRFLLLNFDDLCENPLDNLTTLRKFISDTEEIDRREIRELADLVKPPASIRRYLSEEYLDVFDSAQIETVKRMGFEVC